MTTGKRRKTSGTKVLGARAWQRFSENPVFLGANLNRPFPSSLGTISCLLPNNVTACEPAPIRLHRTPADDRKTGQALDSIPRYDNTMAWTCDR